MASLVFFEIDTAEVWVKISCTKTLFLIVSFRYFKNSSGYVSTLPQEEPDYIKQALEKSVEEITGRPVEQPVKIKMGFY